METVKIVINAPIKLPIELKELHEELSANSKVSSTLATLYIKYLRGEIPLERDCNVDQTLIWQNKFILENQEKLMRHFEIEFIDPKLVESYHICEVSEIQDKV
jgi:hypothetical protein